MELTKLQRLAIALAMKKAAEETVDALRSEVDEEVLDAYLNDPTHPDRFTIAFDGPEGFAKVGLVTIKGGKGYWAVDDVDAFNEWAQENLPGTIHVYDDRLHEVADALNAAGLQSAYYITHDLPKDFQKRFVDTCGFVPIWKGTREKVPGLKWAQGNPSTMVTGCTMKDIRTAEKVLGAPIVTPNLLEGGLDD